MNEIRQYWEKRMREMDAPSLREQEAANGGTNDNGPEVQQ